MSLKVIRIMVWLNDELSHTGKFPVQICEKQSYEGEHNVSSCLQSICYSLKLETEDG